MNNKEAPELLAPLSRLGDFNHVLPKPDNLFRCEWANRFIESRDRQDNLLPSRRKLSPDTFGIIRIAVGYDQSRLKHPVSNLIERMNVLVKLVVFWVYHIRTGKLL